MTRRLKRGERGSTLLMVLVAIVILGLSAGIAGSSWRTIVQRDREAELFFRGDQYRQAIARFHNAWGIYPKRLEELLEDRRALYVQRHLRRLYLDPMTGEPFELVRDSAGTIRGVYSTDGGEPFRRDGFPSEYELPGLEVRGRAGAGRGFCPKWNTGGSVEVCGFLVER